MLAQHSTAWPAQLASPARSLPVVFLPARRTSTCSAPAATRHGHLLLPPLPDAPSSLWTTTRTPWTLSLPLGPFPPSPGALPCERPNATVAAVPHSHGHRPPLASPECPVAPPRSFLPPRRAARRQKPLERRRRPRLLPRPQEIAVGIPTPSGPR